MDIHLKAHLPYGMTQVTHPTLTPPERQKAELTLVLDIYQDRLPVYGQLLIQVVTT